MKKITSILFISIFMSQLLADTNIIDYWKRLNSFDYDGFYKEYTNLENITGEERNIRRGKLAYALYYTGDQKLDWLKIAVESISGSIDEFQGNSEDTAELSYILAESCFNLIVDAPSYFEYSDKYETSIIRCLELEPDNPDYKLNSALSMMRLPTSRGSEEDGKALLFQLEKEFPENISVLMAVSDHYLNNGDIDKAETGYRTVLNYNNNNKLALIKLNEIDLGRQDLEIRNISIINKINTSEERVLKKLSSFKGAKFNFETKKDIYSELTEISTISNAKVMGIKIDDRIVDLEIEVDENNMKALIFMAGVSLGFDYDKDPICSGIPAVVYMDNNFAGSGASLMFLTAGIFNKVDVTIPGLIDDGIIDLKISLTSMALGMEDYVHVDGKKAYKINNTFHGFQVGLGRDLPIGLSVFGYYDSTWTLYGDIDGYKTPDYQQTHRVSADLVFNTAGDKYSVFQNLNGLKLSFQPEWIYKSDYKEWGKDGATFKHNDLPAYCFRSHLGYYTDLFSNQNMEVDIKWLASHNSYESTRFKIGSANGPMDTESISGYIPGEIVIDNGLLSNFKYTINAIPNKINIYGKYDLLYDVDNKEFYNGCALGAAFKIPWDIDFLVESGFGLNANRKSTIGYQFSILFTKMLTL